MPLLVGWLRPSFVGRPAFAAPAAARAAVLLLAVAGTLLVAKDAGAQSLSAEEIMRRNYMVDKVVGSRSRVLLKLRNKHGQERVRDSTTITKLQANGDNQRLVRFLIPPDVKGTAILLIERSQADDDMWIYLPGLKKVRRLVASNKKDSFAGTDFSYGDVIGHAVDDWRHKIVGEEDIGAETCYVIESVPATDSTRDNTGYSKRKSWISKSRFTLLRFEAWDTEGQLLKQAEFGDFQHVDKARDKWVAMRASARNVQTRHTTEIAFSDYRVDPAVSAALFTPRSLEFGRWVFSNGQL